MKKGTGVALILLMLLVPSQSFCQIDKVTHWPGGACQAVALSDEYALAGFGGFLYVIRLQDYQQISALQLADVIYDIVIKERIAYVAVETAGLLAVDFSDPVDIRILAALPEKVRTLALNEQRLYATGVDAGVSIFDLSRPTQPSLLGKLETTQRIYDLAFMDHYIYGAAGRDGLVLIDQQNPSAPQRTAIVKSNYFIYNLCRNGNCLYGSYQTADGLDVFDISNPSAPVLRSEPRFSRNMYEMVLQGTSLFVNAYPSGIYILNVADPLHPSYQGKYDNGPLQRLTLHNETIAAAHETDGLFFYRLQGGKITNPPAVIDLNFAPLKMFAGESMLYFPVPNGGMRMLDLTDPLAPVDRGTYSLYPDDMLFLDHYAYVLHGADLFVLDIAIPWQPKQVKQLALTAGRGKLLLHNNLLFAFAGYMEESF